MRRLLTLSILMASFAFTGCATAHDYCVSHEDHYGSYNECYAERTARSEQIRQSLSHIGDRGNPIQAVNCTTTPYGITAYTSCN